MGYKLKNIKLINGAGATTLDYARVWTHRLCECANFTLTSEQYVNNRYYALLNDGDYCVSTGTPQSGLSSGLYIGLPKKGSGSYYCYGFYFYAIQSMGVDYSKYRIIVDDNNNLVFCSQIVGNNNGNHKALGFLLCNDGVMNIESNYLYAPSASSGETPAQIATFSASELACTWHGNKSDFDIFRSNRLGYDPNYNLLIQDHITCLMSSNKNMIYATGDAQTTAASNAFETIIIDEKKYLHIFMNSWIKLDEVLDETIEVVHQ